MAEGSSTFVVDIRKPNGSNVSQDFEDRWDANAFAKTMIQQYGAQNVTMSPAIPGHYRKVGGKVTKRRLDRRVS